MALSLAQLANKKAALQFEVEGEMVNAEFYPHLMTPKFRALLTKIDRGETLGENNKDSAAEMVSTMLASWDVTADDAGTVYPPTYDNLLNAPLGLVMAAVYAIWEALGKRMTAEIES